MDKRLAKRHKRQVTRAKERIKLSEPDVRTPEEIQAAREASKAPVSRGTGGNMHVNAASSMQGKRPNSSGGASKTDA